MASFQNLPNELILYICGFLAEDIPSLKAMCLTSSTIGSLAQDVLYDRVAVRKLEDGLWPLIRTFVDQPHLTQRVKALTCIVERKQHREDDAQRSARPEHSEFVGKVASCLLQLLPEPPRVIKHMLSGISSSYSQASVIALLFLFLPNLKELDLRPWYRVGAISSPGLAESIYEPFLKVGFDAALRPITDRLDGVHKMFLPVRMFNLLGFFDFRSLDTLTLSLVKQGEDVSYAGKPADFLSQTGILPRLRHVILYTTAGELEDESGFPREEPYLLLYITSAICAPSQSKSTQNPFQCLDLRVLRSHTPSACRYSLKPVVSALQGIRGSLTDLRIVLPCGPRFRSEDWDMFRFVASCPNMDQFPHLDTLVVSSDLLIHRSFRRPPHRQIDFARLLPTSLRKLGLDHPGGILVQWLKGLLPQINEFPDLDIIYLRCIPQRGRSASWFRKHKNAGGVFEALESHGVSFHITDIAEGPPPRKDSSRGDILDAHDGALITDGLGRRASLYNLE